jgi:hypothetical protein
MKTFVLTSAAVMVSMAGTVFGQSAARCTAVATSEGLFRLDETRHTKTIPILGGADAILWTFAEPIGIPETCGLSPFANSAWVGQAVNNERVQRFEITGSGTPTGEFFGTHATFNPAGVAAAQNGDLAVFLNQTAFDGPFVFSAFRSTDLTTPLWQFNVPPNYIDANVHAIRVSRDGGVVALGVYDPTGQSGRAYFFNGNTGAEINHWDGPFIGGIDLTDDGSLALLAAGPNAKLINTATLAEPFTAPGSGSGGWYNISGNGDVLVVGGFSFQVYKKVSGVYTSVINFNAPTSWFSWGSAVSRDGSTVAALSHDYGSGYLNTSVRIWDVASTTLLGTETTIGTGTLQDSAVCGVLSDDGQVFACASWGAQDNNHPEVRVFDRQVQLIASIDTPGSPFSLDLSGNGRYVLAGSKSGHANAFGNGGHVNLLELDVPSTCYANCDGSTASPVLTANDFVCFLNAFADGQSYANCDNSTGEPALTANDFVCFVNEYATGCS